MTGRTYTYNNPSTLEIPSRVFVETSISCLIALAVISIVLSLFSMHSVLLVILGILPGLIAVIVDQEKGRYISRIVLTYNAVGIAPYIIKLLKLRSAASGIETLVDPQTWLVIFGSAALGWIVYWLFPQLAVVANNIILDNKVQQLEKELVALAQEWGEEVIRHTRNDN